MRDDIIIPDIQDKTEYLIKDVINRIILGDALDVLPKLESECVDMVFVDPPYNLQLPGRKLVRWSGTIVDGVGDAWDKFEGFDDYDRFSEAWLREVRRVMKPTATLWVIGTYHNIFRIGKIMQDIGFWILNNVIWLKSNPVPNFRKVRFTNATETLIWAVKDKSVKKYTFHADKAKELGFGKIGANIWGDPQKAEIAPNVWEIPLCAGKKRLKDAAGKKLHSTQKPVRLLERVILTSTEPGDIVLDPMAGTGTTGAAAKMHGRRYVMIEKVKLYADAIQGRIEKLD